MWSRSQSYVGMATDPAAALEAWAETAVYLYFGEVLSMAQKYYDSVFTGAQIDAAVRTASAIASASIPENAGKLIVVDADGNLTAVSIFEIIENADEVSY